MTKDEALKLALEALKWSKPREGAEITHSEAIAALEEVLAQPAQESLEDLRGALHRIDTVAVGLPTFEVRHEGGLDAFVQNIVDAIVALHEQRKPLLEEVILDIADYCLCDGGKTYGVLDFARAIEAAHGIKENT